jgi:hypothetical protein
MGMTTKVDTFVFGLLFGRDIQFVAVAAVQPLSKRTGYRRRFMA